jgi:hypothetical protein
MCLVTPFPYIAKIEVLKRWPRWAFGPLLYQKKKEEVAEK